MIFNYLQFDLHLQNNLTTTSNKNFIAHAQRALNSTFLLSDFIYLNLVVLKSVQNFIIIFNNFVYFQFGLFNIIFYFNFAINAINLFINAIYCY